MLIQLFELWKTIITLDHLAVLTINVEQHVNTNKKLKKKKTGGHSQGRHV